MEDNLTGAQVSALQILSGKLEEAKIPYIVIGGLAAIMWGVKRPLADIDIQVGQKDINRVRDIFKNYLATDLRHYQTENWDIVQMIITINGVTIDICQAEDFICIKGSARYTVPNSISTAKIFKYANFSIPVLPKPILIDYKSFINRSVDQEDLEKLS